MQMMQQQEKAQQEAQQKSAQEQQKNMMLQAVLEQPARARINTIKAVNPAKASQVESIIMRLVQTGQIRGKVNEEMLVGLLAQVNAESKKTETKISGLRRMSDGEESSSSGSDGDESD